MLFRSFTHSFNCSFTRSFLRPFSTAAPHCKGCKSILRKCDLLCSMCHSLQDLSKMTYFDILSSPNGTFDLDLGQLRINFHRLQQKFHPDLLRERGLDVQKEGASVSATINKAYETLRDPFARAGYLMAVKGYAMREGGDRSQAVDQKFLGEILDLRERIDQLSREGESATEKSALKAQLSEQLEVEIAEFRRLYALKDYEGCLGVLGRWKYWKILLSALLD